VSRKFIAVDLDGTLAHYDKWVGRWHIGEPIPMMVERVKEWLANDDAVIIFTSRATEPGNVSIIEDWCERHIGRVLPVTATKHNYFSEIWDDRAIGVEKNTGRRSDGY
jgi:hypothetical protein